MIFTWKLGEEFLSIKNCIVVELGLWTGPNVFRSWIIRCPREAINYDYLWYDAIINYPKYLEALTNNNNCAINVNGNTFKGSLVSHVSEVSSEGREFAPMGANSFLQSWLFYWRASWHFIEELHIKIKKKTAETSLLSGWRWFIMGRAIKCMIIHLKHTHIGVGRFRIWGGQGLEYWGAQGGANSQQAHDVALTSMRRNDVASVSFRCHMPTRF